LRYEGEADMQKYYSMMKKKDFGGVKQEHIDYIDCILKYAGKEQRSPLLFGKSSNILSAGINFLKSSLKEVQNVFTQHKSLMHGVLEALMKGKLSDVEFPSVDNTSCDQPVKNIIVFFIGGTTFEEAREVNDYNRADPKTNIILGGTTIHNSKTFIAECTDINNIEY
jgi:vacuolar protein sorting-associated protein 45